MATVVCDQCGTVNSRPSRFCRNCDAFLDWSNSTEDDPPATVPSQQAPAGSDRGTGGRPGSGSPAQGSAGQGAAGQRPGQRQSPPGQGTAGQGTAGQGRAGQGRSGQDRPGQTRPGQRPPGQDPAGRSPAGPAQPIFSPAGSGRPAPTAPIPATGRAATQQLPPVGTDGGRRPSSDDPIGWLDRSATGCPVCGTPNAAQRRYCKRCGSWLRGDQPAAPGARRVSWWRRLFGLDERIGASRASRSAYRRSLSPAVRLARWLGAIATVVIVALLLNVAGFNPVQLLTDQIGHYRGWGRIDLTDDAVQISHSLGSSTTDGPPVDLIDDYRSPGWEAPWTIGTRAAKPVCDPPATIPGPSVTIRLAAAASVREIGLEPGLEPADKTRLKQYRPRTIQLRWIGDPARVLDPKDPAKEIDNFIQCQQFTLLDDGSLQRLRVPDKGDVTGVLVTVADAYRSKSSTVNLLTIGELSLWQR